MLSKRRRELNRNRCRATSLAIRCRAGPARATWLPPANPATTNPDTVKTGTNPAAGTKPVDEAARRAAAGGHRAVDDLVAVEEMHRATSGRWFPGIPEIGHGPLLSTRRPVAITCSTN